MQRRAARHHVTDGGQIIPIDGLAEASGHLERLDMRLELRPARKAVQASDAQLRRGQGGGLAGAVEVPGLVLEVTKVRALGERAGGVVCGHGTSFHDLARRPQDGLKEGSIGTKVQQVGFYPFRGRNAPCAQTIR
jgi:hypothetical protein